MSQEELAEKAKVSRTTISQLENDETKTTTTGTLTKIANALGVRMESLFLR
jgi:transcriptional regulator with XRE-family HTH domain